MKHSYQFFKPLFCFFLFFLALSASAQNVNIPDADLKTALLNHNPVIDTNGDGQIQVSEAQAFTGNLVLNPLLSNSNFGAINDATGIGAFVNVSGIEFPHNALTTLDVSAITGLDSLNVASNYLTTLDVSSNSNLIKLSVYNNNLSSFVATSNTNMESLSLGYNFNLSTFDPSIFPNLKYLGIGDTGITSIDLSTLTDLEWFSAGGAPLTSLDLSTNVNLERVSVPATNIVELDVSNCPDLKRLGFYGNLNLTYINLKNGNLANMVLIEPFYQTSNVSMVCVDDVSAFYNMFPPELIWDAVITTYCSFTPAQFNTVTGNLNLDIGQGCTDPTAIGFPYILINALQGSNSYGTLTDMSGGYNLYVDSGLTDVSVESNLPSYYSILPLAYSTTFTGYGNTDTADFCIQANATVNDLNITVLPITMARPGFEAKYKIVFENIGTTTLNGQVVFQFDAAKQSFVSAVPTETSSTANSVTFDFTNLQPFHTQEIVVTLLNEQPPIMQLGDILTLTATITPNTNDHTPNDNTFQLNQTVVNSMDPNDKQVLEGDEIAIANADKYLHYLIRFQNMGTASAINVVVTDTLSDQLDWNSIRMVSASDDYRVRITDNNFVEFIFENINLPHEAADAPGSHGYISFKIKPKANIAVGDIITGKAAIYFDFNAPIITNTVSTEVVQNLSTENFELANVVQLYPNPTNGNLYISAKTELEKVEVFSLTGKRLLQEKGDLKKIDLYAFSKGIYFLKITDVNGAGIVKKIVKK